MPLRSLTSPFIRVIAEACIGSFLAATILMAATPGALQAGSLTISDDTPIDHVLHHMTPISSDSRASGHTKHEYRLVITNKTVDTAIWRFSTEMLKPVSFTFYQVDRDNKKSIFSSQYPFVPQSTRASQGRVVSSKPVTIAPGETITIAAFFDWPPADDIFPIRFLPESMHDTNRKKSSYLHGWYFGAALVLLTYFIAFSALLSSAPARFYALYFSALTILTFHSYGYTEQLIFNGATQYYFPTFRLLQVAIMLSYLLFAISFVRAREKYPLLYRVTVGYLALTAALVIVEVLFYHEYFVFILDVMALGFLTLGVSTTFIALRDKLDGAIYFATGYVVLLINGVVNYVASHRTFAAYNDSVDALTLFLQTIDALIFAAAIVRQTYALRGERDDALIAKLITTEEKLQISEKLRAAKDERDRAKTLAEAHRARLAATSHDLRQPLTSLQLALQGAENVEADLHKKLNVGLDYLNTVLGENLEHTLPDNIRAEYLDKQDHHADLESVPIQLLLDNIHRMFVTEANEKGLDLRIANTTLIAKAPTVALIRILSNLVANAIKFTQSGSVLIGARRCESAITLQVYDTGAGMDSDTLKRIIKPYERNDESNEGYGLGLAIVHELAEQHHLKLSVNSCPGTGSVFSVNGLPRDRN